MSEVRERWDRVNELRKQICDEQDPTKMATFVEEMLKRLKEIQALLGHA